MRDNIVDMAVGIIIGSSFGKIISMLANNVPMPPISMLISGMNFSNLSLMLKSATVANPAVMVKYGAFINMMVNFIIVAFAMFLIIKAMNRPIKQQKPAPAVPTTKECLMTIPINAKRCVYCTSVLK